MTSSTNPYRRVTTFMYWLISAAAAGLGILLLYVSGLPWAEHHKTLSNLANQLGGLAIVSVGISLLWELVGRRAFFNEMLEVHKLKNDVVESALESIGTDYTKALDWSLAISNARQLDVFSAWANTWRNQNRSALSVLIAKNNSKLRVFVPDPTDRNCVKALAGRFGYTELEAKGKITEAIEGYKQLDGTTPSGRVEIWTSPVYRVFTSYRIDDRIVVTLYHHATGQRASVPVLVCREGGSLFRFFENDLEVVLNASKQIYP
ncbi:hypothetical protein M2164_004509 [Streptomyces sp. SAI-208]|uniref:hypothetical protein n=1 Tax=Streptomyces sp. SAI-208 TaxID=2940550 RepID=UPI002476222D|nr:hypothetical protein [Streptomyces sp. SAI-208]MDH6608874.1 hypothetical protein [Streptomyces sp. SAI-208]